MKYRESIELDAKEYEENFGHLPDRREELVKYLIKHTKVTKEELCIAIEKEKLIPWHEITVFLPVHPWATPRPKYLRSTGTCYVKGAKKHRKLIQKYVNESRIIYTKTHFTVKTYQETPKAVNKLERILYEMGIYQPLADPDWDNLGKTYSDMVQKVLLLNDNIIVDGHVEKYYSVKPRVEILIQYQESFDSKFNERRVKGTKAYQELVEGGNTDANA